MRGFVSIFVYRDRRKVGAGPGGPRLPTYVKIKRRSVCAILSAKTTTFMSVI